MVAKAAGRVYSVLVSPRRWLTERALAVGPAAIMHAAPLTMPLPCPLTLAVCATAPTAAGSVPGWLPTTQQPSHPSTSGWHSDFGYDEGRGSHAAVISVGATSVKKQPQAASVDWPTVSALAHDTTEEEDVEVPTCRCIAWRSLAWRRQVQVHSTTLLSNTASTPRQRSQGPPHLLRYR